MCLLLFPPSLSLSLDLSINLLVSDVSQKVKTNVFLQLPGDQTRCCDDCSTYNDKMSWCLIAHCRRLYRILLAMWLHAVAAVVGFGWREGRTKHVRSPDRDILEDSHVSREALGCQR